MFKIFAFEALVFVRLKYYKILKSWQYSDIRHCWHNQHNYITYFEIILSVCTYGLKQVTHICLLSSVLWYKYNLLYWLWAPASKAIFVY